ncbi:MAG: phosphatidate cytidylyltransferase [Lentisphaerae bacterium]|nr:phosphatidate cytidylyltransferase [Lentisphaerota bacterium]
MLRHRLLAAAPMIGLTLAAFLVPGWPGVALFALLGLGLALAAGHEFFGLSARAGSPGHGRLTVFLGLCWLVLAALPLSPPWREALGVLLIAVLVLGAFALSLHRAGPPAAGLTAVWVSLGGFVYLYWSLSFMVRVYFLPGARGPALLLYLAAVTKMTDTGAYIAGTLTARRPGGNHKLAPRISPKKSWEGLVGGTLAGVLAAWAGLAWFGDSLTVAGRPVLSLSSALALGLAASWFGLLGDLAESLLKRAAEAKDSGRLPGLGGALDMLDSLIPMGPLFYVWLRFVSGS